MTDTDTAEPSPGQWQILREDETAYICAPDQLGNPTGVTVCVVENNPLEGDANANANVLVAAPEMLESLHELVAGLYAVGITMPAIRAATQEALDRAKAIIAKAEGA